MPAVAAHEEALTARALDALGEIAGVRILGPLTTEHRGGAVSFTVDGHPSARCRPGPRRAGYRGTDGHHCAWPLHRALGVPSSTRATFYVYNTPDEVDALADGVRQAQKFFAGDGMPAG